MSEEFKPYIAPQKQVREFTLRATFLGLLFGLFFAIANGYLALKVGLTVSASIPAAILSMTVLRCFFKNGTILENNIVQTMATIGEGLAAGVVFTIPALIFLGESPSIQRIFLLSALGGILGILFMIPMRRFLIVAEHKTLPYPEGTACAEILKAGEQSRKSALMAMIGIGVAALYKLCSNALFLWQEIFTWKIKFFKNTHFSIDTTPALLGVGYIIGIRITSLMFAGGILGWGVIIPLIKVFGLGSADVFPSNVPINSMSSDQIWSSYVRYIGAGTLVVGGLISLIKLTPLFYRTIHLSVKELFSGFSARAHLKRTEKDISMAWLSLGSIAVILILWLLPTLPMNFLTIVLLVILAFFFVGVTSITVGIVGSTSNPVSGMTILTILIACLVFLLLGWTDRLYLISAITMSCVACSAICIAGTTAQDLKTGFLLGATPRSQQIAEILGVFLPALSLGYVIYILDASYHIGSASMPAPQATMISMIAKGTISGDLPYTLFGIGIMIGVLMALIRVPILPFALGVYLPLSLSTAMIFGALVKAYVDRKTYQETMQERGILLAAGLIGGDACIGIILALLTVSGILSSDAPSILPDGVSFLAYVLLACFLGFFASRKSK